MSSTTKTIGDIGEAVLTAEFLKNNIQVLKPVGDNLPFDLLIMVKGEFKKIQIKTTRKVVDGKMVFRTNVTNPYKKTYRKYTENEVDYFGLYCLENNYVGLLPFCDYTCRDTVIRTTRPLNNQINRAKMSEDYEFSKIVNEKFK